MLLMDANRFVEVRREREARRGDEKDRPAVNVLRLWMQAALRAYFEAGRDRGVLEAEFRELVARSEARNKDGLERSGLNMLSVFMEWDSRETQSCQGVPFFRIADVCWSEHILSLPPDLVYSGLRQA